jgi:hypothetical protein
MGAGKNKSHRKKRISKHVLESVERKKLATVEADLLAAAASSSTSAEGGGPSPLTATPNNTTGIAAAAPITNNNKESSRRERKLKLKDPTEASTYLSLWKYDRTTNTAAGVISKQWKFNKNTQSWLIRHMYNSTKVNKSTFTTLLEYIVAGIKTESGGLESKVKEDATFRARRYKEWETTIEKTKTKKKEQTTQSPSQTALVPGEEKQGGSSLVSGVATTATTTVNNEWKAMDEHEKRKEYKRARKVLDTLKQQQ